MYIYFFPGISAFVKDKTDSVYVFILLFFASNNKTVTFVSLSVRKKSENENVCMGALEGRSENEKLNIALGPFTWAENSRLSLGWERDSPLTLCRPGMEVSRAQLSFEVGLSAVHIPLYVICCLEHRGLVWKKDDAFGVMMSYIF